MKKAIDRVKVLDHGFISLLNVASAVPRDLVWGFDSESEDTSNDLKILKFSARDVDPAISARVSFDSFGEEREESLDLKLVRYLMTHRHNTPIEMTEIWLEMKLPIFVARQFVRHRTATINEVSARYTKLPEEWYIPEIVGAKPTNGAKQGQEDTLDPFNQNWFKHELNWACQQSYYKYTEALDKGVAPEHARMFLHVNHYTHWQWKQDLSNFMHFLSLRLDSHAQVEARAYAQALFDVMEKQLPETMKLFKELRLSSEI